jgi:hypothetical protein
MNRQPIQDLNDGKPWSEMDLFDQAFAKSWRRE